MRPSSGVGLHSFLSTPSARRATQAIRKHIDDEDISIHALREEGDWSREDMQNECNISIHALREEGDAGVKTFMRRCCSISIHALREEGDALPAGIPASESISIHALREEGDSTYAATGEGKEHFYPRPPRGGRPLTALFFGIDAVFLSTPSARRATEVGRGADDDNTFLSTPSARRATVWEGKPNE